MIQDIYPHKLINSYDCKREPIENDAIIHFYGEEILVKENHTADNLFPSVSDISLTNELTYLFSLDNRAFFRINQDEKLNIDGFIYKNLKELRKNREIATLPCFAAVTAIHLDIWYKNNKFCGRCGNLTIKLENERALKCEKCGNVIYPRIIPAIIAGIINKDKILVTKYQRGYEHFALVAGFAEIGETLEETVAREAFEETGLKVKNIRYYKSQPWGISQDLLAGFYCEVDGDTTIDMDSNELKLAQWVSRDEIILQPDNVSLTNEMMMMFKEGKI